MTHDHVPKETSLLARSAVHSLTGGIYIASCVWIYMTQKRSPEAAKGSFGVDMAMYWFVVLPVSDHRPYEGWRREGKAVRLLTRFFMTGRIPRLEPGRAASCDGMESARRQHSIRVTSRGGLLLGTDGTGKMKQ